jgi:hypothetical protein
MSDTVTPEQKFLAALVSPLQDLETLWHQMREMLDPRTSVGVWLDVLGKLVGRPREGVADDEIYRRLIFAQIVVNKSCGTTDELILVAELVVFDDDAEYVVDNTGVAALVLRVEDIELDWTVAETLIKLLRRAVRGGVRIILEWWPHDVADEMFTFNGESENTGFRAFDGTGGGHLASAME